MAECPVLYPMPDIHVCEGGSALLSPVIEGRFAKLDWTGGKGKIEEGEPGVFEYVPGESESEGVIEITLTATPDKGCQVQSQSVRLTMDKMPSVELKDLRKCEGQPITMDPVISSKYDSVVWSSSGTGTFERPNFPLSLYLPSAADLKGEGVMLTVRAHNGVCPPAESTARLVIDELPDAKVNVVRKSDLFQLKLITEETNKVKWKHTGKGKLRTENELNVTYEMAESDEQVRVEAMVTSIFGCETIIETILTQKLQ